MQGNGWRNPNTGLGHSLQPFDPSDSPEYEIPDESESGNRGRYIPSYPVPTQASRSQVNTEYNGARHRLEPGLASLTISKLSDSSTGPIRGIRTAKNIQVEAAGLNGSPVDRSPWATRTPSSPFQTQHVPNGTIYSDNVYNVDDAVMGGSNGASKRSPTRKGSAEDMIMEIIRLEEEIETLVNQREHIKGETSNYHTQLAMLQDKANRLSYAHSQVCENLKTMLHKNFTVSN